MFKKIGLIVLSCVFFATTAFGAGAVKTESTRSDASSGVLYGTSDSGDSIVRVKTAADGTIQATITGTITSPTITTPTINGATITGVWTTSASWVGDFTTNGNMSVAGFEITGEYTLPAADGTADYYLQTDGAGTVDWAEVDLSSIAGTTITGDFTTEANIYNGFGAGEFWNIANTDATGVANTPFININDDRTGTYADTISESSLVIDSAGASSISVNKAIYMTEVAGNIVSYGNFTASTEYGFSTERGAWPLTYFYADANGTGDTFSVLAQSSSASQSTAFLMGASLGQYIAFNDCTDFDDYTSMTMGLLNFGGADANDYSAVLMGERTQANVATTHYFDFLTQTGSIDAAVDATTTEIGATFRMGASGTYTTDHTIAVGSLLLEADLEVDGTTYLDGIAIITHSATTTTALLIDENAATGTTATPAVRIDSENTDAASLYITGAQDDSGGSWIYDKEVLAVVQEGTAGCANFYRDVASSVRTMVRIYDANADSTSAALDVISLQDASATTPVVDFSTSSAAHDQPVLQVTQAGTAEALNLTGGVITGNEFSVAKQHDEIGDLLDTLTTPVAIVGFTGTGADSSTETGYENGAGRVWTYSGGLTTDKIFQGQTYVYSFDGTDSYMTTPDTADMSFDDSGANPFSLGGWVQVVADANLKTIIGKWNYASGSEVREWLLLLDGDEFLGFYCYDESDNIQVKRSTDALISDGWHFIVATYDSTGGATAMNGVTIYVDGVAVDSTATNDEDYVAMENLTSPVYIGTDYGDTPTFMWNGDMGRLFVTPEELSASDVWKMYEETRGNYNK